jgi:hypothetical protein
MLYDHFGKLQNTFAVDDIELVRIEAAFITSAQKGFEQPVVEWIGAFLSNFDDSFGAIRKPGDLFSQKLIPQLPTQLCRKQLSDFATAASIFPFDRDDFNHVDFLRRLSAARPSYCINPLRSTNSFRATTTGFILL